MLSFTPIDLHTSSASVTPKDTACSTVGVRSTSVQTSSLIHDSTDLNSLDAANLILEFRQKTRAGQALKPEGLNSYSEVSHNNEIKLCLDRDYFVKDFLPAVRSAKDSIHLAMFKFSAGVFSSYLADLLIQKKQKENIKIRVIVDNYGSGALFPWTNSRKTIARMRKAGIEVVLNQILSHGVEHRKLLVVDGSTAFFGGSCIADKYFGNNAFWKAYHRACKIQGKEAVREAVFNPHTSRNPRVKHQPPFEVEPDMSLPKNHDTSLRFKGDSVYQLQSGFLQSWLYHGRDLDPESSDQKVRMRYFPPMNTNHGLGTQTTSLRITHGVPWGESEMRHNLLALVRRATQTLDIEIAYMMVPEVTEALKEAAKRGVKITLITNSKNSTDTKIAWASCRRNYEDFLKTGNVKIFETKTYSHVKQFVADRRFVLSSTGNPEYNSWDRGYDELVLIDDPKFAEEIINQVIEKDAHPNRSTEITLSGLKQSSRWEKVKRGFYRLIAWLFLFPRRNTAPLRSLFHEPVNFSSATTKDPVIPSPPRPFRPELDP